MSLTRLRVWLVRDVPNLLAVSITFYDTIDEWRFTSLGVCEILADGVHFDILVVIDIDKLFIDV